MLVLHAPISATRAMTTQARKKADMSKLRGPAGDQTRHMGTPAAGHKPQSGHTVARPMQG